MSNFNAKRDYNNDELFPVLSANTLDIHFNGHHCTYAQNLNTLISNTKFENMTLEEIILQSRDINQKVFNNAGQLYNHNFYWECLSKTKTEPSGKLRSMIIDQYKSVELFLQQYCDVANSHFGSGWSWVIENNGVISFLNTSNAENPLGTYTPICVIDLWEHAYYLDYQNQRKKYVDTLIMSNLSFKYEA